jgi:hypothetical protein
VRKLQTKNLVVICFLLVLIAAGFVQPSMAQIEKLGYLRITSQYPVQVPRSYSFQINVTVEYAFRDYFEISAAIYQGARGSFGSALWEGQVERLVDVGDKTYNVQLTSPAEEGQWLLTGYAFFHNASSTSYFTDQERGPGFVEISIKVADNAKLTLRTSHGNMAVSVDGARLTTDQNGFLVHELKVLTRHSIEAPENVSMTEGWRALFLGWNGTDHANPKTILVRNDLSLTVDYQDEFRLDVVSEVAQVSGTGWYDAGTVANFSVPLLVPQEGIGGMFGIRWKFTRWSGDIASTDHSESVVMNRPYRVVANWVSDYQQLYYFVIGAIVLIVAAVAAFLGLRMTRKPPEQPSEEQPLEEPSEEPSEQPSEQPSEETAAPTPTARTFCVFCGAKLDPDAKFCSKCGKGQVSSG